MNDERREEVIAKAIDNATNEKAKDPTGKTFSMLTMISIVRTNLESAEKAIAEWHKSAANDPRYAIRWAEKVIDGLFIQRFCWEVLHAIAFPERRHWSAVVEDLEDAVIRGRYEERSTCLLSRGVGEAEMTTARALLRTFRNASKNAAEFMATMEE